MASVAMRPRMCLHETERLTYVPQADKQNSPSYLTERTAAAAATAVITALSNLKDDGTPRRSLDTAGSLEPNSKRVKIGKAVKSHNGGIVIEQPAPIDNLPYEIRQHIVNYFEDDCYTLLTLPLVSKVWYVTLMHGKQAEEDWHKRCMRIDPDLKRKKVCLTTWHANFIYLLHDRCMNCFRHTSSKDSQKNIGQFLLYGLTFLRLCKHCQSGRYPMHTSLTYITVAQAKEKWKDYEAVLSKVLRFTVQTNHWQTCILDAAIDQAMILRRREDDRFKVLIPNGPSEHAEMLQKAIAYSRDGMVPKCGKLDSAVTILRKADALEESHYVAIVNLFTAMNKLFSAREIFFQQHGIKVESAMPTLEQCAHTRGLGCKRWIDALATSEVEPEVYLQAVLAVKLLQEQAVLQMHYAKMERSRTTKITQKEYRDLGHDWSYHGHLCTTIDCDNDATAYCAGVQCSRHCLGPCLLHGKPYPVALVMSTNTEGEHGADSDVSETLQDDQIDENGTG